jgi:alkylation response protein AidB-like acyl-CoA dehydrogenase
VVKLFVRDAVVDASDRAVQLAGGGGLVLENTLERHYRDALCGRVHGPADDIVIRGLAETVLRQ